MSADNEHDPASGGGTPQDDGLLLDQAMLDALLQEAQGTDAAATKPTAAPQQESVALSLSQADIDALLDNDELVRTNETHDMDAVIPSPSNEIASALDQSDVDALIASMSSAAPTPSSAPPPPSAPAESVVSQEMIDALIMAATHDESNPPPRMVESVPEPTRAEKGLLTQAELDAMLEQSERDQQERLAAKKRAMMEPPPGPALVEEPAPVPITEKQGKLHRAVKRPRMPRVPVRVDMLRLITSLAAGVIASAAMFTYLYTHQERMPEPTSVSQLAALRPEPETKPEPEPSAPPEASTTTPEAPAAPVTRPLSSAEADKEFEGIHNAILVLKDDAKTTAIELILERITDFTHSAPEYPKLAEVYEWKAALYERQHRTAMAREVYKTILARFHDIPHPDAVLLGAARAARQLGQPNEAMGYARRVLDEYGDSPLVPEAELIIADALAATNRVDDARTIWTRLANTAPETPVGLLAAARLGQVYVEEGRFADAVALLEPQVSAAGKVEGNELLYYLMARAYRGVGRLEDARRRLNDVLTFFGASELIPDAMVELSQVLEELGLRSDAVQMARDAAQRFPENAAALRNEGNLLAANDQKREAAEVLLAALQAGMRDPNLLLDAARDFRAADALPEAEKTYERLLAEFPRAPVVLDADIELSEILYDRGQVSKGIRRLEDLLAVTAEGPPRLPILFSMAKLYQGLGLKTRTAEIYRQIAGLSSEPEVLARAATALLDSASTDEGLAVAQRVDLSKVSEKTAYELLVNQARALETTKEQAAFECLEKAYAGYPKQRTVEVERKLMTAYAARDDVARAQEVLAALDAQAKTTPADAPRFRDVAAVWADHLYDKQDYRAAADWYARAAEGDVAKDPTAVWAAYQLGNALVKLEDFVGSAKAFEQVAATGSEWARDAQIKANYVLLGQRLRGKPAAASPKGSGGSS